MTRLTTVSMLTALAVASLWPLVGAEAQAPAPPPVQTTAGPPASTAPQGPPKVCLDTQSNDTLTKRFADQLRNTLAASAALGLASGAEACDLQLHVPGNLLRFETASGVMVSTVVIVTSPSGRYLSASITACQVGDLKPCAVRAVASAKLAVLVSSHDGT